MKSMPPYAARVILPFYPPAPFIEAHCELCDRKAHVNVAWDAISDSRMAQVVCHSKVEVHEIPDGLGESEYTRFYIRAFKGEKESIDRKARHDKHRKARRKALNVRRGAI